MSQSPDSPAAQKDDLHILGRLSKKFPEKAAKRALWAFCTPPRLATPVLPRELFPNKSFSDQGLRVMHWGEMRHKKALLVHGWGLQGASMYPIVQPLLTEDFQVIAFDGPAHGESPGARATGADFVRAVLALTDQYGPFTAVVGHSVGGAAASIAMGKGAQIERAALLAPAYLPEIVDIFAAQVDLTAEVKGLFLELLAVEARSKLQDWSSHNMATEVEQPVIIFHDPEDKQVSIGHSRTYADLAPQATLHEAPQAGHNRILDNDAIVQKIVQFLNVT